MGRLTPEPSYQYIVESGTYKRFWNSFENAIQDAYNFSLFYHKQVGVYKVQILDAVHLGVPRSLVFFTAQGIPCGNGE